MTDWSNPKTKANYMRAEYDTRHPKFRLTVLGYLMDKADPMGDDFMPRLKELVDYIGSDLNGLADDIENQEPTPEPPKSDQPFGYPDGSYI